MSCTSKQRTIESSLKFLTVSNLSAVVSFEFQDPQTLHFEKGTLSALRKSYL